MASRGSALARILGLAAGAALVTALAPTATVVATNLSDFSVTPATGGANIPASTAGRTWTTLAGPTIDVTPYSNPDVFPPGTTFTLALPANFEWDTAVTAGPTVTVAPGAPAGFCALKSSSLSYFGAGSVASRFSFTLSGTHDVECLISFTALLVRPISGSSSAGTGGNIAVTWNVPGLGQSGASGGVVTMAVTPPPSPTLTLSASSPTLNNNAIKWRQSYVDLTTKGTPGTNYQLQASTDRSTWTPIKDSTGTASTFILAANGSYTFRSMPVRNYWYRSVAGSVVSNTSRVTVRETCSLRSNASGTTSVAKDTTIQFRATVRPTGSALPRAAVLFQIYQKAGSGWTLFSFKSVVSDVNGNAYLTWTWSIPGSWYVRARAQPTLVNANSFWTPNIYESIR